MAWGSVFQKPWLWWGGALGVVAYLFQSSKVEEAVSTGGTINVRLTTYYPYKEYVSDREAAFEGGPRDAAGRALQTLEQYQRGQVDFVSLSGDNTVFPYGQRVSLECWPGVVFRIVDTGQNFSSNFSKVYRLAGHEPIDVATGYPPPSHPRTTRMTIYPGDDFASMKPRWTQEVNFENVQGQSPV